MREKFMADTKKVTRRAKSKTKGEVKNYVLDTNILLQNPQSLFGFADNNVYLCGTTLQELDSKKTEPGELGYNARECCRILDELRTTGDLTGGVVLQTSMDSKKCGTLYVEPAGVNQSFLPEGFNISVPDNRIISTCGYLSKEKLSGQPVILVTNDISMRVNASICGLHVEGYRNDQIKDSNYSGHTDLDVTAEEINQIWKDKELAFNRDDIEIYPNHFITLHAGQQSALTVYRPDGKLHIIPDNIRLFGNIKPLNAMQRYALWALTAPVEEIPLVVLIGPAGTAKTFLSMAAGLSQTSLGQGDKNGVYQKILISKPNSGNRAEPGFGYLPGGLEDKMAPLVASYYDALEAILGGANGEKEEHSQVQFQIDDLFDTGVIELCPLNYIRGRSITNKYIICDEAQNATKGLIRDVVTRAGNKSKVIVPGDENQVDAPTLDSRNNGLIYCAESMKYSEQSVVLRFSERQCVRSRLAEEAIRLMK